MAWIRAFGRIKFVSAYRAEIDGLVNILHILLPICKFYGATGGSVIIYCNCKSAINKLQNTLYGSIKDFLFPDYDLLNEGCLLLKQLKDVTSVSLSRVKGHYNREKSINHKLNEESHSLMYNYLTRGQGYFNLRPVAVDPP